LGETVGILTSEVFAKIKSDTGGIRME
jgi:hypothetical protein